MMPAIGELAACLVTYLVVINHWDLLFWSYRTTDARRPSMAKVTVIYGPMFSGKTKELIERYNGHPGPKLVFKHAADVRTKATLSSHDPELNDKIEAIAINSLYQIEEFATKDTRLIVVDEVQFFDIVQVVKLTEKLARTLGDIHYVFSGLDMDFKGEPFKTTHYLIQKAEHRKWCVGVCSQCGDSATHTFYRKHAEATSVIAVGGAEVYEARCESCHRLGMEPPREQTA